MPIPAMDYQETDMNFEDQDTCAIDQGGNAGSSASDTRRGPGPEVMGAKTLIGNDVYNDEAMDLGQIKEIMLDLRNGAVAYAVLSFGGFFGMGEKLFAVPWNALKLDTTNKRFVLKVERRRLEQAPGFDRDHWPNMADQSWAKELHSYYGVLPYWDDYEWTGPHTGDR
jgi:sporulation protein YlmC with PRC-barrel domain